MRIDRRTIVTGLLASLGAISARAQPNHRRGLHTADMHEEVLLRVGGAEAFGNLVLPRIAVNLLQLRGANDIEILPAEAPWTIKVRGLMLPDTMVSILIRGSTTQEGYEWLLAQKIDIWMAARPAADAEISALSAAGKVMANRVARSALIVAVHPENPVSSLSHDQLREIYTGRITDWRQVGGPAGPINLYGGSSGSALTATFSHFFYGQDPSLPQVRQMPLFVDLEKALAGDRYGIGYLPHDYEHGVKPIPLTIDGHVTSQPDAYGLGTEDYPLANSVFLYRIEKPGMDIAEALVREALSPRSEYILSVLRFQAAGPRLLWPTNHPQLPARSGMSETTTNCVRVNITVHFEADEDAFDPAARQDLDHLIRYLRRLSISTRELVHVCYCQDTGDPEANTVISQRLGEIFAAALEDANFTAGQIVPFGATLKLASDATSAGRRANRRVETWIRP
ncbi:substrate-binding domain-containing protein [Niveispirillum sp.]|uniref:substrate-binding domain-containing protein n=1 Tax=Niveispirillum sp. TaxID=1917217 RepID=UPI001B554DF0|nr:substrate-binding domain-containing protein [Niveispirillum sp.]MBP7338335.1 substrate-binding domain-containing protein [Niveispirillum sp.]